MRRFGFGSNRAGSSRADRSASRPTSSRPSVSRYTAEGSSGEPSKSSGRSRPSARRGTPRPCSTCRSRCPAPAWPPPYRPPSRRGILRPWATAYPYLDAPTPLAFAHRGGAAEGDENTDGGVRPGGRRSATGTSRPTCTPPPTAWRWSSTTPTLRPADRRAGPDRGRCAGPTSPRCGSAARPPCPGSTTCSTRGRTSGSTSTSRPTPASSRPSRRSAAPAPRDRVLLASFSDARLARLRALAGPRVATSLGMREVARLRLASLHRPAGCVLPPSVVAAQVPVRYGRVPVVDRRFVALRAPARAAGARVDDRRSCRDARVT